jgi:N-carbamoylputrescine amidase
MITLLILGGAAVAVLVAGASLRKKNATRETVAQRHFDPSPDVVPIPVTDPEPLPDADPEPLPIIEPEHQPKPEPQPPPEPTQPTIIVAGEQPVTDLQKKKAAVVAGYVTSAEDEGNVDREANVGRTLQSDAASIQTENETFAKPASEVSAPKPSSMDVTGAVAIVSSRTESPTYVEPAVDDTPETVREPPARPDIPPHTDPEPLPDADPEPVPITEPEPQPAPEPTPSPEPPPPAIIVATERPQVSFKTYRVTEPRAAKPAEPIRAAVRPRASRIIRQPKSERTNMSRIVKGGLIQTSLACETTESLDRIREAQTERTLKYIDQAGAEGVQILCMQEIFTGPYFCAEQTTRWYDSTEKIPDGPTTQLMQEYAKKYNMVIVVPLYEVEETGVYYNTAAVIDADGKYLGKYRKNHIPHVAPGFWEKFYFRPGNLGYPVFETAYAKVGVYICYDRHFPEGARELGLAGAEIVMNPSATVAGLSEYLWKLEQPAHAVANGYFIGAINRVGFEAPWNIGEFYGQSYFCDPRGQMLAVGPRDADALVTADLDMDKIREVRNTWQFYRDRRPETYNGIVRL